MYQCIDIELFYCTPKCVAALSYFDESVKAKHVVFDCIVYDINTTINSMFDMCDMNLLVEILENRVAYERVMEYIREQGPTSDIWKQISEYEIKDSLINGAVMSILC